MTDKPSYLGLLNAIANAEAEAERYLDAWVASCTRDDVRQVISTVALREGEHGKAFAKRLCELGYALQVRSDGKFDERMSIASSAGLSDREKFEKLDLGRPVDTSQPDVFARMLDDQSIDIQTGALLGRYIAEERDSGRLLRSCYQALCAEENGSFNADANANGHAGGDRLARIERLLEQLLERLPA